VAPKDLLGLLLLVAAFSPGYVFLRVAEKRHTRPPRSALLEGVELVSIGALVSTVVALAVIALGERFDALDVPRLVRDPAGYVAAEPVRCLVALLAAVVAAYVVAGLAARVTNARYDYASSDRDQVIPGRTLWQHLMRTGDTRDAVVLNVELRDGRILTGVAYGWTAQDADNRELALKRHGTSPMVIRQAVGSPPLPIVDEFVLLRENEILSVYGTRVAAHGRGASARASLDGASQTSVDRPSEPEA
jgi:hypothetical protein